MTKNGVSNKVYRGGSHGSGFVGTNPNTRYVDCGIMPPEKMGAAILNGYNGTTEIQKGAGHYTPANHYNQNSMYYGYNGSTNTDLYAGSYYPTTISSQPNCTQYGGKKHKTIRNYTKKRRYNKKHKSKRNKGKRNKSKKRKRSKNKKRKKITKRQRGGYRSI